ncbi:hypothetical protein CABS01_17081 [Colletotrichum abscissum]|uniref:uncharacterized protein n=1 Tax=Colletotrichum abscissum TaxID=1671311 RepID=UPI0027D50AE1|nr:uncharacterized protein CABS01_17081 [Colletotrichum abscissum]KAK1493939.1 hypothetical protein CABS01_17081 [Colletotrichum abscissum]
MNAKANGVWDFCDPERSTQPIEPIRPTLAEEPNVQQLSVYEAQSRIYPEELKRHERRVHALQKTMRDITTTIEPSMLSWLGDADTPREILTILKRRYQRTPEAEKILAYRNYRDHLIRIKRSNTTDWIQTCETYLTKAVRLGCEEMSVTHQQVTLLTTLKAVYPDFAAPLARETTKEAVDNITTENRLSGITILHQFRAWLEAGYGEDHNTRGGAYATWQQKNEEQSSQASSKAATSSNLTSSTGKENSEPGKTIPTCPIDGKRHWYVECWYLNRQLRPEGLQLSAAKEAQATALLTFQYRNQPIQPLQPEKLTIYEQSHLQTLIRTGQTPSAPRKNQTAVVSMWRMEKRLGTQFSSILALLTLYHGTDHDFDIFNQLRRRLTHPTDRFKQSPRALSSSEHSTLRT